MKTLSAALAVLVTMASLTAAETTAGWKSLFDGTSLEGWRSLKSGTPGAGWKVEDGAIVLEAKSGAGDLVTKAEFGDFELTLEWKVAEATNSGIIYRVGLGEDHTYTTGPEYQVLDNVKGEDNHPASHTAAALYDLVAPPADYTKPVGEWNSARIRVRGWHIEQWLNGHKTVDIDLASPEGKAEIAKSKFATWPKFASLSRGHIALQDHGHAVSYRKIKIRSL
ncbi:MAG TPA: DUF1080 domain-containing protein [Opitutus sp.]|nr:DUF1080 domain-containing protein [Opitutus sp.]